MVIDTFLILFYMEQGIVNFGPRVVNEASSRTVRRKQIRFKGTKLLKSEYDSRLALLVLY